MIRRKFINTSRRLLILITFLVLLILCNSYAFSSNKSGATSSIPLSRLIPSRQTYHMEALTIGLKVRISAIYNVTVAEETGNVEITATSDDFQFTGHYDPSFHLKDTVTVYFNPQSVQLQGYDKRTAIYDAQRKRVTLKYYIGSREIRSKTFDYDERMVDSEAFFAFLQGMLLKGVKDFQCAILSKFYGRKLDAGFKLVENVSLSKIAPQTKFPDLFQDFLARAELFDVYEMRLTGIVGVFYSAKFYFAYRKSPAGCTLAAYWGGAGEDEEYFRFK